MDGDAPAEDDPLARPPEDDAAPSLKERMQADGTWKEPADAKGEPSKFDYAIVDFDGDTVKERLEAVKAAPDDAREEAAKNAGMTLAQFDAEVAKRLGGAAGAAPRAGVIDPADPDQLVAAVREAARLAPSVWGQTWEGNKQFGKHDVYIGDLYDAMKDRLPAGTTLDEFKQHLMAANATHSGPDFGLARVDMPPKTPEQAERNQRSEVYHPRFPQPMFHKVNVSTRDGSSR